MTKSKTRNKAANKYPRSKVSRTNQISGKKVIGASALVGLVGLAGFGIGQAVQNNEHVDKPTSFVPVYSVSQSELNSSKNLLGRLRVADSAQEIPNYDSEAMST